MDRKTCNNPACRAENPVEAKFCRKCGTAFTPTNAETVTTDTFQNSSFLPVSVVKLRFVNRFVVFLCVLFAALWYATDKGFTGKVLNTINPGFYEDVFISRQHIVESVCLAIAGLCVLHIFKGWIKKLRYILNADYIEKSFVNNEIVRISSNSQMGLFDKSKKKVLLSSTYSDIEKFNNQLILISNGNKYGLYSLTYRKIIIPVLYDSIAQFKNSVISATIQGTEHLYDLKGNQL